MKNEIIKKIKRVEIEQLNQNGRYISPFEFKLIMDYPFDNGVIAPKRLIMAIMYFTGMRCYEVTSITKNRFNEDCSIINVKIAKPKRKVIKGKRITVVKYKSRTLPLPEWLSKLLVAHISVNIIQENGLVFAQDNTKKICHTMNMIRRYYRKRGYKQFDDIYQIANYYDDKGNIIWQKPYYRIAVHGFRSRYATQVLHLTNNNFEMARKLLGHNDISTTAIYVRNLDIEEVKIKALNQADQFKYTPQCLGRNQMLLTSFVKEE